MTRKKKPPQFSLSYLCSILARETKGEFQGTPDQIWHLGNVIQQVTMRKELATAEDLKETETHLSGNSPTHTQEKLC